MRDKLKKMCWMGICVFFLLLSGCRQKEELTLEKVMLETDDKGGQKECTDEATEKKHIEEKMPEEVHVYVCGEVKCPGVYEFAPDSRVCEAIQVAGGMTDQADRNFLNQAEKLTDGQQIYVPSVKETKEEGNTSGSAEAGRADESGKVNINSATKEVLMTLSGIGESKAESILQYREENGKFQKVEDLMKVEGIKSGVFHKIKDKITV